MPKAATPRSLPDPQPLRLPGLAGRVAWVTGHRGGIGSEIARVLEASGCDVLGLDLPEFDLSDLAGLEERAAQLVQAHGAPRVLVNCAGTTLLGAIPDTSLADLQRVMAVNFMAAGNDMLMICAYWADTERARPLASRLVEARRSGALHSRDLDRSKERIAAMLETTSQNDVSALSDDVFRRDAEAGTLFSDETAEVI